MKICFVSTEGTTPSASKPVDCASKCVLKCSTRVEASLELLMRKKTRVHSLVEIDVVENVLGKAKCGREKLP